jgi:hypothetical protein
MSVPRAGKPQRYPHRETPLRRGLFFDAAYDFNQKRQATAWYKRNEYKWENAVLAFYCFKTYESPIRNFGDVDLLLFRR